MEDVSGPSRQVRMHAIDQFDLICFAKGATGSEEDTTQREEHRLDLGRLMECGMCMKIKVNDDSAATRKSTSIVIKRALSDGNVSLVLQLRSQLPVSSFAEQSNALLTPTLDGLRRK